MGVHPSTQRQLEDHLGQAELSLKVAASFECLKGTPAQEFLRAALAQVAEARKNVRTTLQVSQPGVGPPLPAYESLAQRRRIVQHRMSGLAP